MTEQLAPAVPGSGTAPVNVLLRQWRTAPAWNRGVILVLVAALIYLRTWVDLWPLWNNKNATYTHGTLIAAIVVWLLWRTREELKDTPVSSDLRILPAVLLLSLAWMFCAGANLLVVHTMLWPPLAFVIVWAGAGWPVARRFAFPLAFLYFAIPFWDYFEPALQAISSNVVGFLIKLAGTQASVDGPYILLPTSTIYIALTCSGAHFLAISLAMGTLAGEIRKDLPRTRLFIILFAGLLSMAFNSIRILLIVLAHLHSGLREGFETIGHITFGWWVFAIDLLVFLIALRSIPHSRLQATTSRDAKNALTQDGKRNHLFWATGAALALPVASAVAQTFDSFPDTPASAPSIVGMTGPISPDARWQPSYAGFAWEQRAAYITDKGRVVELYANRFHRQSQDNELIAHGRELFSSEVFEAVGQDLIGLESGHRPTVEINRLDMRDAAGRHWLALFTYTMDNEFTTSRSQVQLATAWRGLYRRPSAGVLAVAAPCVPDCASTELDLRALMAQAMDAYTRPRSTP